MKQPKSIAQGEANAWKVKEQSKCLAVYSRTGRVRKSVPSLFKERTHLPAIRQLHAWQLRRAPRWLRAGWAGLGGGCQGLGWGCQRQGGAERGDGPAHHRDLVPPDCRWRGRGVSNLVSSAVRRSPAPSRLPGVGPPRPGAGLLATGPAATGPAAAVLLSCNFAVNKRFALRRVCAGGTACRARTAHAS